MIALIQRVAEASVIVDGERVGEIGAGLLALVCAERDDTPRDADALLEKMLAYRIFADERGRMNKSLRDVAGNLLLVPQFTLAADTRSGTRPSFTPAAAPDDARRLFDHTVVQARAQNGLGLIQTGIFGAHMKVALVNDGPVTFWLSTRGRQVS
ncbi:D-tyrosyl-tRNA(Tyr) deacylase [Pigmentiphaga aceris]|uniref:D-aminoacyl-tRNA deacylase n=1 Tax=Pigmentiphaga aceris TaxID=1940612 RepID=A0A5C0AS94_9BURK|nr:D-aminoacyl-tRNA deacylase [Pigmentiphaga aceris]QEI05102.1 D-tyrosyl-tRNA(Tyr) deacylase [Pigmentiphaga aceris]